MEPLGRRRSNDSQVTLVDASSASYGSHRPYTFVSFSRDNMKNTTIFAEDGVRALYSVETDMRATRNAHTRVYRGIPVGSQDPSGALLERERELVAEVKRKELREDRIKFGGAGKSKKISKWLHGANGRWTDFPASFEWGNKLYTWRTNHSRQIALYEESDPDRPIAWFQTSRQATMDDEPVVYRALLALQQAAVEILDGVVVSLLIVEQGLRLLETKWKNADGRATFMVYF